MNNDFDFDNPIQIKDLKEGEFFILVSPITTEAARLLYRITKYTTDLIYAEIIFKYNITTNLTNHNTILVYREKI